MTTDDQAPMTPERYDLVFEWFNRLLEAPADELKGLLAEAEGVDANLRGELESLLAVHDTDVAPVADAVEAAASTWAEHADGLAQLGRYRIIRKLADGGMGTVYLAEQDRPRRQVALKVIRGGLASPDAIARFELEAELLGTLEHPGIATIHEAGTEDTPLGPLPFFAMEYVDGLPLDEHAEALPVPEKLELLALVCGAVQHAHQKGIVHRDLKPANVLVDGTGQPKVLDFGVARLQSSDARTLTQQGQIVGTLPYMSPEQVRGDPAAIDTRADVYALGALGYTLLAGRPPHRLEGLPITAAASTILDTAPRRLGAEDPRLRGDVETIISKALEKEPERRYASAEALADDLRRYLADEPIAARPPSALYVLGKFTRRHRTTVTAAVLLTIALLWGLISTTRSAAREARQRARADRVAEQATHEAYRAQIGAASAALQVPDLQGARLALEAVSPEHRSWEWRHLHARLDDSVATLASVDAPERGYLLDVRPTSDEFITLHGGHAEKGPTLLVRGRSKGASSTEHTLAAGLWALGPRAKRLARLQGGALFVHEGGDVKGRAMELGATVLALHGFDAMAKHLLVVVTEEEVSSWVRSSLCLVQVDTGVIAGRWTPRDQVDVVVLAFDASGQRFAVGHGEDLLLYTVGQDEPQTLGGHAGGVKSAAFAPQTNRLCTMDGAGTLRLFALPDGHELERHRGARDEQGPLAFSGDGHTVAVASRDGTLRLFDAETLRERARLAGTSTAEASCAPRFLDYVQEVVTARRDGTVQVFSTASPGEYGVLTAHDGGATSVAWGPGGQLATVGRDGFLRTWEAEAQRPLRTVDLGLDRLPMGGRLVEDVRFAGTDRIEVLAISSAGRTRLTFDADTLQQVASAAAPVGVAQLESGSAQGDVLVRTPGGRVYLSRRDQQEPPLWSVVVIGPDGTEVLRSGPERPLAAAVSTTDDFVRVLLDDGRLDTFSTAGLIAHRVVSRYNPRGLALVGGGARWLLRTADATLLLFDPQRDLPLLALRGHHADVRDVAVSPDGETIASVSDDGTLRLWTTKGGGAVTRYRRAHPAPEEATAPVPVAGPTTLAKELTIQLESTGAAPRRQFAFEASDSSHLLDVAESGTLTMALGGMRMKPTAVPPRTVTLRCGASSISAGLLTMPLEVRAFQLPKHPMMARMQRKTPGLEQVTGAKLTLRASLDGRSRELVLSGSTLDPAARSRILEIVDEAVSDVLIPLPQEPLGIGGKWRVVETARMMGVDVQSVRIFEVVAFEDAGVRLRVTRERRAPDQDIEATGAATSTRMTLTDFTATAEGEAVWRPGLPALHSLSWKATQHVGASIEANGMKQSVTLDLEGSLRASLKEE